MKTNESCAWNAHCIYCLAEEIGKKGCRARTWSVAISREAMTETLTVVLEDDRRAVIVMPLGELHYTYIWKLLESNMQWGRERETLPEVSGTYRV